VTGIILLAVSVAARVPEQMTLLQHDAKFCSGMNRLVSNWT